MDTKEPPSLDVLIAPRRTDAPARPAFHSRRIRALRRILPLVALALVVSLFVWNAARESIAPVQQAPVTKAGKTIGRNEVVSPRFESVDSKGHPFSLTAERAVRDTLDERLMLLDQPRGTMALGAERTATLRADSGTYTQDDSQLLLSHNVVLALDSGHALSMPELRVDVKRGKAWTERDVTGTGPDAELSAHGLEAYNDPGRVLFKGPAKLVLYVKDNKDTRVP